MRERVQAVKAGKSGLEDVALLASFVVNAIHWGERVTVAGKPIELKSTSKIPSVAKAEHKANLREYLEKAPKAYTELMVDFGQDIAKFKSANPRGKSKASF